MNIRRAQAGEAASLSELVLNSKALWGYEAAFLERCRGPLAITEAMIATRPIFVADGAGSVTGVAALSVEGDAVTLTYLFVAPHAVRRGIGRGLWAHALGEAQRLGCLTMTIQSDPFAEAFYLHLGAQRIGTCPSEVDPERRLPLLQIQLGSP